MPRSDRWVLILLSLALFASLCLAQKGSSAAAQHHRKSHKAAPKPAVLPPLRPGPLPQLPLDLMPAAAPKVSFQGGLLTIVAQNSTLSDILRDVHKLTGASIDAPPNATERVVTRLGPAAPREVLASLLNGSSFNYVMVGSGSNPSSIVSVVLTTKPATGATQTATSTYQPPQPVYTTQMPGAQPLGVQQIAAQPVASDGDDANADDQDAADANANQDQTDGQQPAANTAGQQDPAQAQPPNAGPKTPEQILEMLRRQQPMNPGQPGVPPSPQQPPPQQAAPQKPGPTPSNRNQSPQAQEQQAVPRPGVAK